MRHDIGHKYNGLTENGISVDNSRFLNPDKQFFWFLLSSPFRPVTQGVLAIPNLAHLFLQKGRQKKNKLNSYCTKIGVLRTLFARVLSAPKGAPQAFGINSFDYNSFVKSLILTSKALQSFFMINKLGFAPPLSNLAILDLSIKHKRANSAALMFLLFLILTSSIPKCFCNLIFSFNSFSFSVITIGKKKIKDKKSANIYANN